MLENLLKLIGIERLGINLVHARIRPFFFKLFLDVACDSDDDWLFTPWYIHLFFQIGPHFLG